MSFNQACQKLYSDKVSEVVIFGPISNFARSLQASPLNITFPNTCSRNKRRKHCEESRWRSQSALVRPLAMSCFKQTPRSHWFLSINSQYLQPYWLLQQTSEHTKIQKYKATKIHTLTPLTYELFFSKQLNKWKEAFF